MAYEQREGQGSLFKNEKQNDRQPDYRGTIMIGGVTYEVAAWERTSQRGAQYLSLQASQQQNRGYQSHQGQQTAAPRANYGPQMQAPAPTEADIPADGLDDLPF